MSACDFNGDSDWRDSITGVLIGVPDGGKKLKMLVRLTSGEYLPEPANHAGKHSRTLQGMTVAEGTSSSVPVTWVLSNFDIFARVLGWDRKVSETRRVQTNRCILSVFLWRFPCRTVICV
jgi:hypothetical protein